MPAATKKEAPAAKKTAAAKEPTATAAKQEKVAAPSRIALSPAQEKKLAAVAADLFPDAENRALADATVVYGRKLLKFAGGKRSSKPPVPPALQGDRETTRRRLVTIAKALDVDPAKIGFAEATEEG